MEEPLKVLDLFAGAGGLTEGFRQIGGFASLQAVELDQSAAATFAMNHPSTAVHQGRIEDWLAQHDVPHADVVVGGPPCQGFSTLGKQDSEDVRNRLWEDYVTTVARARPKFFIVENVAAFSKSEQFQRFQGATGANGPLHDYRFQSKVLNAADYGTPQARRRTVVIGHHRDLPFPGWPASSHADKQVTVREAFADVPSTISANTLADRHIEIAGRKLPGAFLSTELHVGRSYTELSRQRFEAIPEGGNRFDLPDSLKAPCWRRHTSGSGDVMGRLRLDRPSVTIRTEFFKPEKGRYLHPTENRAISHFEAAVLQGFPRDYKWVGSKVSIARQIGNAVPVDLSRALARQLKAALSRQGV